MPTNENKLKLRMIRSLDSERDSSYIVLDKFLPYDYIEGRAYYLAFQLYESKFVNLEDGTRRLINIRLHKDNEILLRAKNDVWDKLGEKYKSNPIARSENDVWNEPSVDEYQRFAKALMKYGLVYNKKTCQLTKINLK